MLATAAPAIMKACDSLEVKEEHDPPELAAQNDFASTLSEPTRPGTAGMLQLEVLSM